MTLTLNTDWDEAAHTREIVSGRFADHLHTAPELTLVRPQADRTPFEPTFRIQASAQDVVTRKIAEVNARLARLHIPDRFTYDTTLFIDRNGSKTYEFAAVTVHRPVIGCGEWLLIGAHDFPEDGTSVHFESTESAQPVTSGICDHCGATHADGRVYTATHVNEGQAQVGAGCLASFTGRRPRGLWALVDNAGLDDFADFQAGKFNMETRVHRAEDVLLAALSVSDDGRNYVAPKDASWVAEPTFARALRRLNDVSAVESVETQETARAVLDWVMTMEAESGSYLATLKQAFTIPAGNYVRAMDLRLAVSAVSAYRNQGHSQKKTPARRAKTTPRQPAADVPAYLAAPKEKVAGVSATIQSATPRTTVVNGRERVSTWLVMVADSGHVLTWSATGDRTEKPGDRVAIAKAVVKSNDTFNGKPQTNLTRATMAIEG